MEGRLSIRPSESTFRGLDCSVKVEQPQRKLKALALLRTQFLVRSSTAGDGPKVSEVALHKMLAKIRATPLSYGR
jgi:hypothetical protein